MTSKERLLAAADGRPADRTPMTTWCFGFPAPDHLKWQTDGRSVDYWYTMRLEHLHTLPQPWTLEDDFKRFCAWRKAGIDDALEISIPWATDPEVSFTDSELPVGAAGGDDNYATLVRQYSTPGIDLRHAIKKTGVEGPGWPIQPADVPLFEDYNIPRAVDHLITDPRHVEAVRYLYAPPGDAEREWFAERSGKVGAFAGDNGAFVQAWSAFGMDAAVWLTGAEGAVMMSIENPRAFAHLIDLIAETDYARTALAAGSDAVDMVCQRGWYSSTDFWSPALFDEYVFGPLKELCELAHSRGKKFAYVMTTGVETLGPRLADAGVDVLFFVDPIQDRISLARACQLFGERMTLVGGTNALSLQSGDEQRIREEVRRAIDVLGPTNRFILHPVDAIFPDTPWDGVATMIDEWKRQTA